MVLRPTLRRLNILSSASVRRQREIEAPPSPVEERECNGYNDLLLSNGNVSIFVFSYVVLKYNREGII